MGFTARVLDGSSVEITASIETTDGPEAPVAARFVRGVTGNPAFGKSKADVFSQGPGEQDAALDMAGQIGLSGRQTIHPHQTLTLPARLSLPSFVDIGLKCLPEGPGQINDRPTLVLSCVADQKVHTDDFTGQVRLSGTEEIDLRSGVRLAADLSGRMEGDKVSGADGKSQFDNYGLSYTVETEFQ
jgi:hypothetical protein